MLVGVPYFRVVLVAEGMRSGINNPITIERLEIASKDLEANSIRS
jgi:hypothetical protein